MQGHPAEGMTCAGRGGHCMAADGQGRTRAACVLRLRFTLMRNVVPWPTMLLVPRERCTATPVEYDQHTCLQDFLQLKHALCKCAA